MLLHYYRIIAMPDQLVNRDFAIFCEACELAPLPHSRSHAQEGSKAAKPPCTTPHNCGRIHDITHLMSRKEAAFPLQAAILTDENSADCVT